MSERGHAYVADPYEYVSLCVACGTVIDFCQGHGFIGDPEGRAILDDHDNGVHTGCHPDACDEATETTAKAGAEMNETHGVKPFLRDNERVIETIALKRIGLRATIAYAVVNEKITTKVGKALYELVDNNYNEVKVILKAFNVTVYNAWGEWND